MKASDLDEITSKVAKDLVGIRPASLINNVLTQYLLPGAGLIMFLFLIFGGFQIMFSGGDPKAVEAGKSKITTALIGFIIVFVSYWIVQAIAIAFGLKSVGEIF